MMIRNLIVAALVAVSFANASHLLWRQYHMPVLQHDDMWYRDASLMHTKDVLKRLGASRVAYLPGPNPEAADVGEFFANQFLLTPIVLRRNSPDEPFVLVYFGHGSSSAPMPGLSLVEDFGNGLALFRRPR